MLMSPIVKKPVPPPETAPPASPAEPKVRLEEKAPLIAADDGGGDDAAVEDLPPLPAVDRKGKGRAKTPAFQLLPREIIQEILYAADPDTFDSLTLLNSCWHQASRSARLYAHQLEGCGVSVPPEDVDDDNLSQLVRTFTTTARRELFESILRPRVTEIQLICSASSSAAAFPGGEAFRFEFSAKGTHLLALSSSRIFVLDLSKRDVQVTRELKISRRPVAATILDDGSVLAVLSSNHHVTLYSLAGEKAQYLKSFPLANEPRTIALSPGAEVLGCAYNGGIEVYSLHEDALPTDRRAVNCDTVDSLSFSTDGTILLGTTLNTRNPTTVIVSAQHFSIDLPCESLAQLWTTQVLFPRSSRDSSHASLVPDKHEEEGNTWTFTYDRTHELFRAVRVDDLRNGHTYLWGPGDENHGASAPATLPASTRDASMVAAGFVDGQLLVYGLPTDLEPSETSGGDNSPTSTPERSNSNASRRSLRERSTSGFMFPQWQVLRDKIRNVFVPGRKIGQVDGLAGIKFVRSEDGIERLVAVAGGGVDDIFGETGEEEFVAIGGGRVILYDLERSPRNGETSIISVEIGDGIQGPVEALEERFERIEDEVDIVRRRTVAIRRDTDRRQKMAHQSVMPPSPTETRRHSVARPTTPTNNRRYTAMPASSTSMTAASPSSGVDVSPNRHNMFSPAPGDEESQAFDDAPYAHGAPRSRQTLYRAATVTRHTPQPIPRHRYANAVGPDGRPLPQDHDRSHARVRQQAEEEWIPPPPPYTPRNDNEPPLPPHLLLSLQGPPPPIPPIPNSESRDSSPSRARGPSTLARTRSTLEQVGNAMRRRTVFGARLTTHMNASTPDISAARSAPATPAVANTATPWTRPAPTITPGEASFQRRGSAGDILNLAPSMGANFAPAVADMVSPVSPIDDDDDLYSAPTRVDTASISRPSTAQGMAPPPAVLHDFSFFQLPTSSRRSYTPEDLAIEPATVSRQNSDTVVPPIPPIPQHHLMAAIPGYVPPHARTPSRSTSRSRGVALRESYGSVPGTPTRSVSGRRSGSVRTSMVIGPSGSVRRRPSRAQRSAEANMREARERKKKGHGRKGREEGDGKNCSIM